MSTGRLVKFDPNGPNGADAIVEPEGGSLLSAEHYSAPGDDASPLPDDAVALVRDRGTGRVLAVGYEDPNPQNRKAAPGEKRTYARDGNGDPTAEIWCKSNGDVEITSIRSGGVVIINGVRIDQNGNVSSDGEITAKASSSPVKLSTHLHPTGMGPSGQPTPGT